MSGPRADARRNRERIVEVARVVVREQGTGASLRDIARRAGVGLGTLYRHFPSREALLETLTRRRFEHLTARAADPTVTLGGWLVEFAYGLAAYRGLPGEILATLADDTSPLHEAAVTLRRSARRLLADAQRAGRIREDLTADELFALLNAVGWIAEQAPTMERERLLTLLLEGLDRPVR